MAYEVVMKQCMEIKENEEILKIIDQYLARLEICDGQYRLIDKRIAKDCALAPVIRANPKGSRSLL